MTKDQFKAALEIAQSKKDLSTVDDTVMDGCGLPGFNPVTITLDMAAKFLRWQCFFLNGQIDSNELNNCRNISRKRWLVV